MPRGMSKANFNRDTASAAGKAGAAKRKARGDKMGNKRGAVLARKREVRVLPPEVVEAMKSGRPTALFPSDAVLKLLAGLAQIGATTRECAAILNVAEGTFIEFLKRYPKAKEIYEDGPEKLRVSLRRKQLQLADKNAAMAIFLGKNLLGQRDTYDNFNLNEDGPRRSDNQDRVAARLVEIATLLRSMVGAGGDGAAQTGSGARKLPGLS